MLSKQQGRIRSLYQVAKAYKGQDQIGVPSLTRALELTNYGDWGKLDMSYHRECPKIIQPNQILVRNLASSLNRHDFEMKTGYIQPYLDICRKTAGEKAEGFELPLVLGRDFAGVVMDTGPDVKLFTPGDEVFGATSSFGQGCFSDFVVVEQNNARHKPPNLSFVEAASLPYVSGAVMTACCQSGLKRQYYKNLTGKRVLIHGAGGGVGTIAVQLLKSAGAHIVTTSLVRSFKLLKSLGADETLAFRAKDFIVDLETLDKFDLILDIPGHCDGFLLRCINRRGSYVSFKQRLYENIHEEDIDLAFGMMKDILLTKARLRMKYGCKYYYFSYMPPHPYYLDYLLYFLEDGTIVPVVQDVIGLEEIPDAMKRIEKEDVQGKTVVDMMLLPEEARQLHRGETEAVGEIAEG
ncbi:reticulon-4-interacting protein 1, mitochondrial-like [Sycon ciliatum]|uniref:reticulon-4-interacting protein 1, mitochondrial-like n=1 Tax=Sycon ciliatum TaxID=27933 RepID=UPI0031F69CB6